MDRSYHCCDIQAKDQGQSGGQKIQRNWNLSLKSWAMREQGQGLPCELMLILHLLKGFEKFEGKWDFFSLDQAVF